MAKRFALQRFKVAQTFALEQLSVAKNVALQRFNVAKTFALQQLNVAKMPGKKPGRRRNNAMRGMPAQARGNRTGRKKNRGNARRGSGKNRGPVEQIGTAQFFLEPRRLEITVPVPTNTPNEWVWKHWTAYRKIKKGWFNRLHSATIHHCGIGKFGHPVENASLTIERLGIKELDEDNLKGGVKPVIDSLIQLGFLANDTPDVIQTMNVYQTHVDTKAAQGTRITLIERNHEAR